MNDSPTYELVHSSTPGELSQAVSERINDGWWPMGTPFVRGPFDDHGLDETVAVDKRCAHRPPAVVDALAHGL